MSADPLFLTVIQILTIHRRSIELFGGDASVRDQGLLESASAMPQAKFGGEFLHDGISAMAAAYLFHICKNHPFVDGNKRAALAAAEVFVILNDHRLDATNDALEHLTLGVASGTHSKDDATAFFRRHTLPLDP